MQHIHSVTPDSKLNLFHKSFSAYWLHTGLTLQILDLVLVGAYFYFFASFLPCMVTKLATHNFIMLSDTAVNFLCILHFPVNTVKHWLDCCNSFTFSQLGCNRSNCADYCIIHHYAHSAVRLVH